DALIWGWILATAADRSIETSQLNEETPLEILNRFGLARFLKQLGTPRKRKHDIMRFLKRVSVDREYKDIDDWIGDLMTHQAHVPKELIPEIAQLYEAFDVLIASFLFPGVARQIVVERAMTGRQRDWASLTE